METFEYDYKVCTSKLDMRPFGVSFPKFSREDVASKQALES